jgi:mutator protein MutT|tara:strand:+ start:13837 stop:14265 length:429 start_codon:yes stop_codon:yes gene_type:complete
MMNFRLAAKSFIVKDGKLLILKRSPTDVQRPNIWEIPGGRLELGEDPRQGIKRETKEETGIDIEVLHPINVRHFNRDDGQTITLLIFLCKALNNNLKISKEHSAYEWISLENCKAKLTDFFHEEVDIFNRLELSKLYTSQEQ